MDIQGEMQVDVSLLGDDGWGALVRLEVQMLREMVCDYSQKTALLCHRAKQTIQAKGSISSRLRALISGTALGRSLWGAMKDAADAAISPSSLITEVRERAEAIRKSGIETFVQHAKNGSTLLDMVGQHPTLLPALLKTKEALVQLPGSVDSSCQNEQRAIDTVVSYLASLVQNHGGDALEVLSITLEDFWKKPMDDPRWYKHTDVLLHTMISNKARLCRLYFVLSNI